MEQGRQKNKRRSIQDKILKQTLLILVITVLVIGGLSVYLNYEATFNALKKTMEETVEVAADGVESQILAYQNVLYTVTLNPILTDNKITEEEKQEYLNLVKQAFHFEVVHITDETGNVKITQEDLSKDPAFQAVKSGNFYISDLFKDPDQTKMHIRLAVPIQTNGTFKGMLYGDTDASVLSALLLNINIGDKGNAAILDKNGNTIGFQDYQLVLDQYNTQKEAKTDKKLKKLAEIEKEMTKGEIGSGQYYYNGNNKFMSYRPIEGTNGWSIDVSIVRDEFLSGTKISIKITIVVMLVAILVSYFLMVRLSKNIVQPIRRCVDRLTLVVKGDLTSDIPDIQTRDETQLLAETTHELIINLKAIILDLMKVLKSMAEKNFDVRSDYEYVGDFQPLKNSIEKIIQDLNQIFGHIYKAADHVSTGSFEISSVAQNLSEGATSQAASVEELTATITDITGKVTKTAESAKEASELSKNVTSSAEFSNDQMKRMSKAMEEISNSSQQIEQIIKTIDDIAAQTNLLSLNASIEAARAGEAGRGFAVVANEIRSLAEKSGEAVQDTAKLIENSLKAVGNGNAMVNETARSLKKIVEGIEQTNKVIQMISENTSEQSEAISQTTIAVEQISEIIQSTSAIAQESAASSEELSGEAQILKKLLDEFQFQQQ